MQESKRNKTPFWDTVIGNIIFVLFIIAMGFLIMWLFSLLTMLFK